MDEELKAKLPLEFGTLEGIQNLDTSRMALRWALERIRSLEKINGELLKKADWELKMRLKSEQEFKSQGELENTHQEEVLRSRQAELEAKFSSKLAEWERDYQRLKAETQRQLPIRRAEELKIEAERRAWAERLAAQEKEIEKFRRDQESASELDLERVQEERRAEALEWRRRFETQRDSIAELERRLATAMTRVDAERPEPTKGQPSLRRLEEEVQRKLDEHLRNVDREKTSLLDELTELRRKLREADESLPQRPEPRDVPAPPPPEAAKPKPAPAPAKKVPVGSSDEKTAASVYGEAVSAMRAALEEAERAPMGIPERLRSVCRALQEAGDNPRLLALCARATADNYLYAHSVNTAILALRLGKVSGWAQDRLYLLGLGALLHELGMFKHFDAASGKDWEASLETRAHPLDDAGQRAHPRTLEEVLRSLFAQGAGRGRQLRGALNDEDLRSAARLISRCDLYDAMSHPRPWRPPLPPHEALKRLMRQGEHEQDRAVNRGLVETLSLYPPASLVRLSSGEIARVRAIHPGVPTRPDVEVILDAEMTRAAAPRPVSLLKDPRVHIVEAVDLAKIELADREFLEELKAELYWTD